MLVSKAAGEFIRYCRVERHLARNTTQAYRQDLSEFAHFVGRRRTVEDIYPDDIRAYRNHMLSERRHAPTTAKRRLSSVRLLFRWLVRKQKLDRSPLDALDIQVRIPERLPRTLTTEDASQMVSNLFVLGTHVAVIVGLLINTGLRVGELVRLHVDDVDLSTGRIRVFGKGSRERIVYLSNEMLRQTLKRYVKERHGRCVRRRPLLLTDKGRAASVVHVRRLLSAFAKAVGIRRRVTPHMLRHTAATMLIEAGTDIRFVQRLLGHRSIMTTQIYAHVSDSALQAELARADVFSRLAHGSRVRE